MFRLCSWLTGVLHPIMNANCAGELPYINETIFRFVSYVTYPRWGLDVCSYLGLIAQNTHDAMQVPGIR